MYFEMQRLTKSGVNYNLKPELSQGMNTGEWIQTIPTIPRCTTPPCDPCYPMVTITCSTFSPPLSVHTFIAEEGGLPGDLGALVIAETKSRICSCLCASPCQSPKWCHLQEGPWDALPDPVNFVITNLMGLFGFFPETTL